MLAQSDKIKTDAVSTIYDITHDSILRQEIRARDERIAVENRLKKEAADAKAETAKAKKETAEAKKETAEMKKEITKTKKQLAKSEQRIAELEEALRQALEK